LAKTVKGVNVMLKKLRNPRGAISIVVRRASDDFIVHTFGKINAPALTNSDKAFTLEAASSYTIAADDRMLTEWDDTASSTNNQIWVKKLGSNTSSGFDSEKPMDRVWNKLLQSELL
jgi:hypothetical protein